MAIDSRCTQRTRHSSGFLMPSARTSISAHGGGKIWTDSTVSTNSGKWITTSLSCHGRCQAFKRSYIRLTSDDSQKQEQDWQGENKTPPPRALMEAKALSRRWCPPVHALRSGDSAETDGKACIPSLNGGLIFPRGTVQCAGDVKRVQNTPLGTPPLANAATTAA